MLQGRVTFTCKSLRGVRAPNTSSPLRSVRPEYSMSIIQFYLPFRAPHSRGKNHQPLLVHSWKAFLMLLDLFRARHLWVLSMQPFHLCLHVSHTFGWLPSILVLRAAFLFHKIPKFFHRFIPSLNLSCVGNDLTFDDPFHLLLQISFDFFGVSWGLFAIWSVRGSVGFQQRDVKHGMNFPPRRYF